MPLTFILFYFILFYFVLFFSISFYSILFYSILCYFISFYFTLFYSSYFLSIWIHFSYFLFYFIFGRLPSIKFEKFSSRLPSLLWIAATYKQEMELPTCICTSSYFCHLFPDPCWGRMFFFYLKWFLIWIDFNLGLCYSISFCFNLFHLILFYCIFFSFL